MEVLKAVNEGLFGLFELTKDPDPEYRQETRLMGLAMFTNAAYILDGYLTGKTDLRDGLDGEDGKYALNLVQGVDWAIRLSDEQSVLYFRWPTVEKPDPTYLGTNDLKIKSLWNKIAPFAGAIDIVPEEFRSGRN
jgi:hypothetical protein